MNDEIKEILDKLDCLVKNEMCWWENYTVFSPKDTKILLDYITNLQQENKELKDGYQQEVYDKNGILNRWYEAQGRIDKAIEYIKHAQNYGTMAQIMSHLKPYVNGNDLLNILQNGGENDGN